MDGLDEEFTDEVPISAIAHWAYCPRRCALIHVEQTFDENIFTVRGNLAHERVDSGADTIAAGVRVQRNVPLWSERLGLSGKADLVEFRKGGPFPVEYKVGRPGGEHAELQLCAQALCLEEMLGATVLHGAVFSYALRERRGVRFTPELRQRTEAAIAAVRVIFNEQSLPAAPNDKRCPNCSLLNACLPSIVGEAARIRGYEGALFRPRTLEDDPDV